MKILDHHAVSHLYEHARYLSKHPHDMWRCIHFNLSCKEAQCSPDLRLHFVIEYLENVLEDTEGEIYVCDDGDIFILFPGALRPIIHKLGLRFKDIEPDVLWEQPKDKLFTIFDMSKYWPLFYTLCAAKYQHAMEAEHQRHLAADEAAAEALAAGVAAAAAQGTEYSI